MKQADSQHLTSDGNVNNAAPMDDQNRELGFLAGGGATGGMVRAHDWASTSLGAPEAWPQSLKSVLSACLNSPLLGAVLWGPELLFLYNDAYIPSLADRHPGALGRPVAEVWGDAWEQVAQPFYQAMRDGEGFSTTAVPITMTRNGVEEVTYWDFTAAPIRDEAGHRRALRLSRRTWISICSYRSIRRSVYSFTTDGPPGGTPFRYLLALALNDGHIHAMRLECLIPDCLSGTDCAADLPFNPQSANNAFWSQAAAPSLSPLTSPCERTAT